MLLEIPLTSSNSFHPRWSRWTSGRSGWSSSRECRAYGGPRGQPEQRAGSQQQHCSRFRQRSRSWCRFCHHRQCTSEIRTCTWRGPWWSWSHHQGQRRQRKQCGRIRRQSCRVRRYNWEDIVQSIFAIYLINMNLLTSSNSFHPRWSRWTSGRSEWSSSRERRASRAGRQPGPKRRRGRTAQKKFHHCSDFHDEKPATYDLHVAGWIKQETESGEKTWSEPLYSFLEDEHPWRGWSPKADEPGSSTFTFAFHITSTDHVLLLLFL